jgi:hypothetical protein
LCAERVVKTDSLRDSCGEDDMGECGVETAGGDDRPCRKCGRPVPRQTWAYCSSECRPRASEAKRLRARKADRHCSQAARAASKAAFLERCGNVCEACGTRASLCLDHDHETGRARGILCNACNSALGLLKDSAQRLDGLLAYVRRNVEGGIRGS